MKAYKNSMIVYTLAPSTYHYPEPEITLCEAESDYKGEGSELRQ